jgi:hypothetical protein
MMLDEQARMARNTTDGVEDWDSGLGTRPRIGKNSATRAIYFPEVEGLTSQQYADAQEDICNYARQRILTVGAEQYDRGSVQRFESCSVDEVINEAMDELADLINYAAQAAILLNRIRAKVSNLT